SIERWQLYAWDITIKTIKLMLKKALQTNTDAHLALLSLRNTPITGLGFSPAELLMGRVLRSTLPVTSPMLKPRHTKKMRQRLTQQQQKQKNYYDQHTKSLSVLGPGAKVSAEGKAISQQ
uniref:Uncharacterized protein n=1 Tax=Erpetoichthys calabaricus TaxID=27687 RepID=A0A8C4X5V5_ERPCA